MDIGPVNRPVPPAPAASPRAEAAPIRGAVTPDLPAPRVVTPSEATEPTLLDLSPQARSALRAEEVSRNTVVDAKAKAVIFRTVDTRTGEVVQQIPDEALLKIRAYARAQAVAREPGESVATRA